MTASTQISQAAKDAAAEIDGGWDYASKCEVIQTAMNHAVGEIREQLDDALEHQELPYHTCAGKDCKNSHCQLRQERDRLAEQVEQLKKELTLKQDGNPEWLLARNQDLRQALMPVCQELNIPWGDYDKAKDAVINLCAQVEQRESAIKLLLGESRTLRAHKAELQRDKERLDWLEKRKAEHYARWEDNGWRDLQVSWCVSYAVEDGTYNFPKELLEADVRSAIDAAMQKEGN